MNTSTHDATPGAFRRWFGLALLAIVFLVCLAASVRNTMTVERPKKAVVRIAHWQLERGYREALDVIIRDYEALRPDIHIEQVPLPDRVYAQSINMQLISNTAPDICEMGNSDLIARDNSTIRYFLPLSAHVVRQNPYNADTDLADVPWRDTVLDGMRSGFREGLADYYGVPTTLTSMRLYYNKTLLELATGSDAPPATFGQWMTACEKVRQYAAARDSRIVPIVTCYDLSTLQQRYAVAFTAAMENQLYLDLNGDISQLKSYVGFCRDKVGPRSPQVRASYEIMRAVGEQMQQGFSAMDRQQAQYRFVNGLAVFMWTGSWDAGGTQSQAKDKGYDVGVFRPPLPAGEEHFAEYVATRSAESADGGGLYGIVKSSPQVSQAVDFLMYLTSRSVNEKFNRLAEWPPITIGARPSELMAPFIADPNGESARVQLAYGTRAGGDVSNEAVNYFQGDQSLDQFLTSFEATLRNPHCGGDWAWWNDVRERQIDVRGKERVLAQQQLIDLLDPATANPERYRRSLLQQVLRNNSLDSIYLFRQVRGQPMPAF